jgi:hypothetical protein
MNDKTPRRTVRIDDRLWDASKDRAQERGDNLSEVIRKGLASYLKEDAA